MRSIILILIFSLLTGFAASSQENEKYGSSKDLCLRNISLYKGYLKNKDFKYAKDFWHKMIEICPQYSTGIWSDGEKIFKASIKNENDPLKRMTLIDSLMWTYDKRIEYFGNHPRFTEGYILGKKGLALLSYEVQPSSLAYEALKRSVQLQKQNSYPAVILTLMKVTKNQFTTGMIDAEEVVENYSMCMGITDKNLALTPDDKDFQKVKTGVEQFLINSKAADCTTLVDIFSLQFEDNKSNSAWLNKINDLLKATACKETDLYMKTTVALFNIEPTSNSAHVIANMFFKNNDYKLAIDYLEKGVDLDGDSEEKASMYYDLSYMYYSRLKDFKKAKAYALKASELRPNWGEPYLLIGKMYIDDRKSVSENVFEQDAVFWAAVDMFIKAKNVDPEEGEEANELIKQYSQYFPINEDVFMWTLADGDEYQVRGWINETTTVRSRKN